ncbi:MAG TPA: sigma-70 family RNA polymerase sigma factor [Bryobacteraceae bacterium]|jgi:RNA polymerase sigma-70 factor (ECF subfamily)
MEDANKEQSKLTDQQLVELTREGDGGAFGELVRRHWRKCVDLGCFFLRNRGDAEDQVQNAVIKAYQHLDQYLGEAEFGTWLARIVANQCLMLIRERRRARFVYLDEPSSEPKALPLQLAATGPDPEGAFAFVQMTQVLEYEVNRIPRLLRNVVLLRDIQGLPMRDVAGKLGLTVSAAKSRLIRARAELRNRMSRHVEGSDRSSPLARVAAPLSRVGRHCSMPVNQ